MGTSPEAGITGWLCSILLILSFNVQAADKPEPLLVIVIDDLGDNQAKGIAAINLPGALTYAFLPHTPFSSSLAKRAYKSGKEVILHAPMENKAGLRLGPGALTQSLTTAELAQVLNGGLDAIPNVVGMNNHMGSLLTEDRQKMQTVMRVARNRGLFFLDSMTTPATVAWKVAAEQGVPVLMRDVFLDNKREREYIHQQFVQALALAVTKGQAVAIGHPYPETVAYLAEALPQLAKLGIKLVTASELLELRPQRNLLQKKPSLKGCDRHEGHCPSYSLASSSKQNPGTITDQLNTD